MAQRRSPATLHPRAAPRLIGRGTGVRDPVPHRRVPVPDAGGGCKPFRIRRLARASPGWLGTPDAVLLGSLRDEGLTLVTNNWRDFEPLLRREEIHAGSIVLPNIPCAMQIEAFERVLRAITTADPTLDMINTVVDVDLSGEVRVYPLP